jgi:ferredoxin-nitrite reductase
MANPVEQWKQQKHGFDVWPDVQQYAAAGTPMKKIDPADLERMKWYGFFYRKRDQPGRYMNRIRVTGSQLTAEQAKEVAYLAYEHGHGIIDVTTRANLQVQGLDIQSVPYAAQRLEAVGLSSKQTGHDNIRNVFGHPFSGLMDDELFDTRPLCHDITSVFLDNRQYADLPRKFNICINGARQHSAHFWTQDISFLAAHVDGSGVAFRVLIGGTQGQNPRLAWHLPVLVQPHQVIDVTRRSIEETAAAVIKLLAERRRQPVS